MGPLLRLYRVLKDLIDQLRIDVTRKEIIDLAQELLNAAAPIDNLKFLMEIIRRKFVIPRIPSSGYFDFLDLRPTEIVFI